MPTKGASTTRHVLHRCTQAFEASCGHLEYKGAPLPGCSIPFQERKHYDLPHGDQPVFPTTQSFFWSDWPKSAKTVQFDVEAEATDGYFTGRDDFSVAVGWAPTLQYCKDGTGWWTTNPEFFPLGNNFAATDQVWQFTKTVTESLYLNPVPCIVIKCENMAVGCYVTIRGGGFSVPP